MVGLVWRPLGDILVASCALLLALWKPLVDVLDALWGKRTNTWVEGATGSIGDFGLSEECMLVPSDDCRGGEGRVGKDVPHVLPRGFNCNALPVHLQRQVFF